MLVVLSLPASCGWEWVFAWLVGSNAAECGYGHEADVVLLVLVGVVIIIIVVLLFILGRRSRHHHHHRVHFCTLLYYSDGSFGRWLFSGNVRKGWVTGIERSLGGVKKDG